MIKNIIIFVAGAAELGSLRAISYYIEMLIIFRGSRWSYWHSAQNRTEKLGHYFDI